MSFSFLLLFSYSEEDSGGDDMNFHRGMTEGYLARFIQTRPVSVVAVVVAADVVFAEEFSLAVFPLCSTALYTRMLCLLLVSSKAVQLESLIFGS